MSHCDSHESEGGHPDEVCAYCGTCIQCTGGKWSDHMDASCAQGIDTRPEEGSKAMILWTELFGQWATVEIIDSEWVMVTSGALKGARMPHMSDHLHTEPHDM